MGRARDAEFFRLGGETGRIENRRILLIPGVTAQPSQDQADVTRVRVEKVLAGGFGEIDHFSPGRTAAQKAATDKQGSEVLHGEFSGRPRCGRNGDKRRLAPRLYRIERQFLSTPEMPILPRRS